jgi:phosphate-selective porin OprO/OprP
MSHGVHRRNEAPGRRGRPGNRRLARLALAGLLIGSSGTALAKEPTRAELEDRIRRLERIISEAGLDGPKAKRTPPRAGVAAEAAPPAVDQQQVEAIVDDKLKKQKVLAGWKDGFFLESPNGDFKLKLRGYAQAHGRFFPNEDGDTGTDSFFMRRVRPIFEGTVYKYFDFRIMPDFGGGTATLQDGYMDVKYFPYAKFRAGKFKPPFSIERLQSGADLLFVERSIANNLAPNRDVGLMLYGDFLEGSIGYQAGVFNGTVDGSNSDGDTTSDKEGAGRIFAEPFKATDIEPLKGLGFGVAGTYGRLKKADDLTTLAYRTAGRSRFFRLPGSTSSTSPITQLADGHKGRVAPQAYWYWGPFGAMGEYIRNDEGVRRSATDDGVTTVTDGDFVNDGWFIQASYVLTGEDASYRNVVPIDAFDPRNGRWGAFEVALRGSRLNVDDDLFDEGFADRDESSSDTWAGTVGLNWYLNKNFKFQLNYEYTSFDDHIEFGNKVRDHENVILGNCQISY